MTTTAKAILEHLDDAEQLEALYQRDPRAFHDAFEKAKAVLAAQGAADDSPVMRVWQARLNYSILKTNPFRIHRLGQAIGIGLFIGLLLRLAVIWLDVEWFYPRFAPMLLMMGLVGYFLFQQPSRRLVALGSGLFLVTGLYVSQLAELSDSVVMALIHLPLVFIGLVGLSFLGPDWREPRRQIGFLRYLGELLVLASLLFLGGMVLGGITVGLFSLLNNTADDWFGQNAVPFGIAGIVLLATYVYDEVFNRRIAFAGILARIFAPLFLLMVSAYLLLAGITGQNPFVDREFLIIVNGLLVLVLGITVFSLVEREAVEGKGISDYINLALISVTLLINTLALAAIAFRLASYGLTPNRITVLGINLVVFGHLSWLFVVYLQWVRHRASYAAIECVIGRYLPVYLVWSSVVLFLLPILFDFR